MTTRILFPHTSLVHGAIVIVLALCAAGALAQPPADGIVRYTVLSQNKVAGQQTVQSMPGGKVKVEYSYRDNGRGPDLFEQIRLGDTGRAESIVTTGKATIGAPIDESFSRKSGRAAWRSKADRGEKADAASALYVPIESSIEMLAISARALMRAPGKKLPALPSGQLAVERLVEAAVTAGDRSGRVALYAITGMGTSPSYVWLWADAAAGDRLFGMVMPAFSVLKAGWEANADALLKLQVEADSKTLHKLARELAHRSEGLIVIRNVRWFDSENAAMRGPSDIHVYRGKVASIFPARQDSRS